MLMSAVAGAAAGVAFFVFGLVGFGSDLVALPLLVLVLPIRNAVPIMAILDLCFSSYVVSREQAKIAYKELSIVIPAMAIGIVIGSFGLATIKEELLAVILGTALIAYSLYNLMGIRPRKTISKAVGFCLCVIGGVFTALIGTGGPLYLMYMDQRIEHSSVLRATMSTVVVISALLRVITFWQAGLLNDGLIWKLVLIMLPCSIVGILIGRRVSKNLSEKLFKKLVWTALGMSGVGILAKFAW